MIAMVALFGAALVAGPSMALIGQEDAVGVVSKHNPTSKSDPSKLICRTNDVIGSRLKRERRCFTSAEWEELRQLDRRAIDKIQANRYNGNS